MQFGVTDGFSISKHTNIKTLYLFNNELLFVNIILKHAVTNCKASEHWGDFRLLENPHSKKCLDKILETCCALAFWFSFFIIFYILFGYVFYETKLTPASDFQSH